MSPWEYQTSVFRTLLRDVVTAMGVPVTVREPNRGLVRAVQPDPTLPPTIILDWNTDAYQETVVDTVGDDTGRPSEVVGDLVSLLTIQGGRGADVETLFLDTLTATAEAWMVRARALGSGGTFWLGGVTPGPFYYEGDAAKASWYAREVKLMFRRIGLLTAEEVGILANLDAIVTPPVPGPGLAPLDCVGPVAGVWQKVKAASGEPACRGIVKTGTDSDGNVTVYLSGLAHFPAHGLGTGTRYLSQAMAGAVQDRPLSGPSKPMVEVLGPDDFIVLTDPEQEASA